MTSKKDLKILLIGKTGNGKSATGNSILGREKFDISSYANSRTKLGESGVKQKQDFTLTIFDTRGLFDADSDTNADIIMTVKHMESLMNECPIVDAFLLVLRVGTFSAEDQNTIQQLKTIFGPNFIKDYCYLVLTHGDNYDKHIPFNEYCENSTGKIKELFNECNKRIFLITNKGDYEKNSSRVTQGENLIAKLQAWLAYKSPYRADTQFKDAALVRKQLVFEADIKNIKENFKKATDQLTVEIERCVSSNTIPPLDLMGKLHALRNDIKEADPDSETKNLEFFLEKVEVLIRKADSLPHSTGCVIL